MANPRRRIRNRVSLLAAALSVAGVLGASSLALAAPPAGGGPGAFPGARGVPFQALQSQINNLAAALAAVETQIAALQTQVQALQVQVAANTASIQELQAWRQATDQLIGALLLRVELLTRQVQQNTADIAAIQALNQAQDELLAALQASVNFLKAQVQANTSDIRFLFLLQMDQQRLIDSLRSQISFLQFQVSRNTGDIASMQLRIGDLQAQVSSLQSQLADKQNLIRQACAPGSSIRQINFDGSVVCEFNDVGRAAGTLDVITVVSEVPVAPGAHALVFVSCPFPLRLTGGGHATGVFNTLLQSRPFEDNSWVVLLANQLPNSSFLAGFARCARVL